MFNWKKKIDDAEDAEKLERERREAEQKTRQVAEQEQLLQQARKKRESLICDLGKRFKCSVCNTPSMGPRQDSVSTNDEGWYGGDWHGSSHYLQDNWNYPGDLDQCTKCNEWTCANHIYRGICQTCAEKM